MRLDNPRIVLVQTSHPGNIGATARAMKNMGLKRLVLVQPAAFPHPEASARAAEAVDILAQAQVVDSLDAALADCRLVIGTSTRRRGVSAPLLDPRQCAARIVEFGRPSEVAVLFGRESSGLTNDETDRCHYLVRIPTDSAYSSLNLAAAVLLIAYELRMAALAADTPEPERAWPPLATAAEMEHFYGHLEQVLLETGFLDPVNPRPLMRRLRRLFNRVRPDQREVNILRGILTAVRKSVRR